MNKYINNNTNTYANKGAWSTGGMISTEEDRSSRRTISPISTLSTINPTWIGLGLNPDLGSDRSTKSLFFFFFFFLDIIINKKQN
jgi:hypothetical protein